MFSCLCILVISGACDPPAARAATPGTSSPDDKKKFCVIVRPASPEIGAVNGDLLTDESLAHTHLDNPLVSFFRGQVRKIGFGVPKSFSVTRTGSDYLPAKAFPSPNSTFSEGLGEGREDSRCFFPSVGYYSRFSQEGTQAVAIGVGLKGPDPADGGDELPKGPDARVAVMFGFAF